jgi:chaperonin GroES
MKFRPLNDRLLVKRSDAEETTKSGLFIPDSAKEKPMQGKVLAVGCCKKLENGMERPLEVQAGQTVFFRKYAGTEVTIEGEDCLILREDEVLAICE